ncbi:MULTISPECIES: Lrp/AsnC family transcriptional regulator [unclassified Halomonas]|uniref:Lrp/AsnC family transcriptional regulator n=1 Tax=unclassified Halomonas TaxID=2609666 RepID=UPI0006DB5B29|nr:MULTISPECIES: Lrp/AsnC family transcriptional regulator [unclassified Halomonas]KPQ20671.1 MAG: Lrp/AsnC family transcriptional regulator, leucine-responsive regulatory protein [Halomonas sp. HL-93]SBR50785.1 transcriptional regulator, AsnC family [Halomonas sp. HL-93]SNY97034.1 transcriptional regulator, AsnC family [Halomonas sp. hl-4]
MDRMNLKIIRALRQDGRISVTKLSQQVGLSIPAVTERMRKLEESGVIKGYTAVVDLEKIGLAVSAVIGITAFKPQKEKLLAKLDSLPEVAECLHVTGEDSYLIRIYVPTNRDVEEFVAKVNTFGETKTRIVLSEPISMDSRHDVLNRFLSNRHPS